MAKTRLNMVNLMNIAWDRRVNSGADSFQEKAKNLFSHAHYDLEASYKKFCARKGFSYNDEVFYMIQRIMVFLMMSDGDFLQGEYDTYVKYCNWCGIKPLSVADCKSLDSRLSANDIIQDIDLIKLFREDFDPENYQALIQGFCYLALTGDKALDENEYYIIRCFFEPGYDYVPATWEQFKREW